MSKLFLRRYRFHTAVNRRDKLNKVRNWAVHKTKQETVSTCRMAAHLGMQHQQPDGWAEISAVSSVKQEGFCCWSGFRYIPFLQALIKGLFISRSSYFRSFKKRWRPWMTEIYPLHGSLSSRLGRSTGPRTSAKTSFPWVIHMPLGDSSFLALGFFVLKPVFPRGCERMLFWGPEAKDVGNRHLPSWIPISPQLCFT